MLGVTEAEWKPPDLVCVWLVSPLFSDSVTHQLCSFHSQLGREEEAGLEAWRLSSYPERPPNSRDLVHTVTCLYCPLLQGGNVLWTTC